MNHKTKETLKSIFIHTLLSLIVIICLFPVVWMCIISIKTVGESITGFNALRIANPTLANYKRLFELIPIWSNLYNSVFTSVIGTLTTLFFCSLAGYAFAKYEFPGRNALFYFIVGTMMVSPEVGAIPL
ncbi:MAG: carbohydrate ABC transporter permease, partial [Firmicutes bacterium]|nr:carbohydrate ABC transporter permease [Bacillota bacterium]